MVSWKYFKDDFSKQKIVWGEISDKTKFALDNSGIFCPEATTFFMIGLHLHFLMCFLNSSLSEYLFAKIGTTTGVGTVRWKKFKIEQMLVPTPHKDDENMLISYLNNSTDSENCEMAINNKIFRICGLSEEEIEFIDSAMN